MAFALATTGNANQRQGGSTTTNQHETEDLDHNLAEIAVGHKDGILFSSVSSTFDKDMAKTQKY